MPGAGKTALVLAGGGSLGAVQAGMLAALCDKGIAADFVVGASAGAINAGFFAANPTRDGARALCAIWRAIRRADVMPVTARNALNLFLRRGYLFDNSALRALLARHIRYRRLEEAAMPVHVVASDILSGEEVVLSRGPTIEAILASAAISGVFPSVRIDGRELVDGGVANNTPISTAIRFGGHRVIVLPTGFACRPTAGPERRGGARDDRDQPPRITPTGRRHRALRLAGSDRGRAAAPARSTSRPTTIPPAPASLKNRRL